MNGPSIFLLGFMGCGKSSTGKGLSEYLKCPFIDLDELIEQKDGRTIRQIFFEEGEAWFRKLETETLYSLAEEPPSVVALGGGTPCFGRNMDWIIANSFSVFMQVSSAELAKRLFSQRHSRPLIKDLDEEGLLAYINDRLEKRRPFYERANVHLNAENASPEELSALLGKKLKGLLRIE